MSLLCLDSVVRSFSPRPGGASPKVVLDGLNLEIGAGEVAALVGRSGAGKTTILHLAAGLCRPSQGRVLFEGTDLEEFSPGDLSRLRRDRIGLVFQNNLCLSTLPVWENAALGLLMGRFGDHAHARRRAEETLERVGLGGFGQAATSTLSGGQRRRLGIARAMLGRPALLLADEPTADLDEETGTQIEELVFDWLAQSGVAALIVTHSISIQRRADRVLKLDGGRLSELDREGSEAR